jgi:hypothetical protein
MMFFNKKELSLGFLHGAHENSKVSGYGENSGKDPQNGSLKPHSPFSSGRKEKQ